MTSTSHETSSISAKFFWLLVWRKKITIIVITGVFAIASLILALALPNIFRAETLLAPTENAQSNLSGMPSELGGIAALAGFSMSANQIDKLTIALELVQSKGFLMNFVAKNKLLVPLMASEGWNRETNELVIDDSLYDGETNTWVREIDPPQTPEPTLYEAFLKIKDDHLFVDFDKSTGLVKISFAHYSPELAQKWLTALIEDLNLTMRMRDIQEAEKSLSFLEKELMNTDLAELRVTIYNLMEQQTQKKMLANVREEYILSTIDPAIVPERRDSPNRLLILILGTFAGGMISILFVIFRYFSSSESR